MKMDERSGCSIWKPSTDGFCLKWIAAGRIRMRQIEINHPRSGVGQDANHGEIIPDEDTDKGE